MGAARLVVASLIASLAATGLRAQTPQGPSASTPARAVGRTHDCSGYYPPSAERRSRSGDVLVQYDVEADGRLTHIVVLRSSGFAELDRAAQTCVSEHWRDLPATRGGVAVASPAHRAIIEFRLTESTPEPGGRIALLPGAKMPAAVPSTADTGDYDALAFFVWTLGPLAVVAWLVYGSRLWVFRRRDCPSCGARNRSIVPFAEAGYCSSCGIKFAPLP
ncbi:MAG: energy transducer TonB [Rhizomicrobium sp.]